MTHRGGNGGKVLFSTEILRLYLGTKLPQIRKRAFLVLLILLWNNSFLIKNKNLLVKG